MNPAHPHFLLFSEAQSFSAEQGVWRFQLETVDGRQRMTAADQELGISAERLQLLSIVRGLEALDQPSRVTLITSSRYVVRGIRFGLEQWRSNGWQWEDYGRMSEIAHADLWQRLDSAMQIHDVHCRSWRVDKSHSRVPAPLGLKRRRRRSTPQPQLAATADKQEEVVEANQDTVAVRKNSSPAGTARWSPRPESHEAAACLQSA